MTTTWALLLAFGGMAALSLAMDRHHEQLTGREGPGRGRRAGLRVTGTALLIAALWSSTQGWGASVGVVVWLGCLSAGALAVTLGLSYAPRLSASSRRP